MKHIALIGGRATGKSTVSKHLAKLTGKKVYSIDKLAVKGAGMSLKQFVATHGWKTFRELEYRILKQVCQLPPGIIDCGGGIVCEQDDNNHQSFSERKAQLLKDHCQIFWLSCSERTQLKYMHKRPSISGKKSSAEELTEVMKIRKPWYQKLAEHQINTDKFRYKGAAEEIKKISEA